MKHLINKHIKQFHDYNARAEENIDIENEIMDKSDEAISVYSSYMVEIISAFVFFSKPNIEIDVVLPAIKDSAAKIIEMTKFFIEVKFFLCYLSYFPTFIHAYLNILFGHHSWQMKRKI